MIKRFCLSSLLIGAALIHFLRPELFFPAIPHYLIYKNEIILFTGLIELLLGAGLLHSKSVDLASRLTSYYLIALLPIHIYVSIHQIEIFGIQDPRLLWGRTLFQFVIIYFAYTIDSKSWVIEQRWKDVVFLHYKIPAELIRHLVPYPLDLHEGNAIISIVPFQMDKIRFPFLPIIPWVSNLWELNIRTYVDVNGIKGVYFFTLETDSKIGTLIANKFFSLPYRFSKIKGHIHNNEYLFEHQRSSYSFELEARIHQTLSSTAFDRWATERYSLFTRKGDQDWQGTVIHSHWELQRVEVRKLKDDFSKMIAPYPMELISMAYSKELKVKFKPFKRVSQS